MKVLYGFLLLILLVGGFVLYNKSITKNVSEINSGAEQSQATAAELREQKKKWIEMIIDVGPDKAQETFLEENQNNAVSAHDQAHAFGEALYEVLGLPGLGYCDSSFEFGCYHSFFGVAVAEEGIEILPQFADACKKKYGDFNLPCEHGIGHGVLVYTDYDNILKALELCETVSLQRTGGCSSGVFMEYNFHTMDDSVTNTYYRKKTNNLYEPCDTLPERFQASCYLEQVQWWQVLFESDFKKIATLCDVLPKNSEVYDACFHGIGNYLAAEAKLNVDTIIAGCRVMPDVNTQALCHEGASWLVRGDGSGIEDAQRICTALLGKYKNKCQHSIAQ